MDSTSASATEQIGKVTAAAKNTIKGWNHNKKRCLFIKQRQGEKWLYKYELLSTEGSGLLWSGRGAGRAATAPR